MPGKNGHRGNPEQEKNMIRPQTSLFSNGQNKDGRDFICWIDRKENKALYLVDTSKGERPEEISNLINDETESPRYIEVESAEFDAVLRSLQRMGETKKRPFLSIKKTGVLMVLVCDVKHSAMKKEETERFYEIKKNFKACLRNMIEEKGGELLNQSLLLTVFSFSSALNALQSAMELQEEFYAKLDPEFLRKVELKIGLSGTPDADADSYFDKIVKSARRMSYVARKKIVLCPGAGEVCRQENLNMGTESENLALISDDDYRFLTELFDYMERRWQDDALHVDDLARHLNCSKSQVYRKMVALSGLSPNSFIKEYRLDRAVDLFNSADGNIAEVAFEAGFSSPSYFTKCFHKRYRMTPSEYIRLCGGQA